MAGVFAAIGSFFTALLAKIVGAVVWIGQLFVAVFVAFWLLLTDAFVWVFDAFMGLAVVILGGLDLGDFPVLPDLLGGLPGDVLNILGLIGFGEALAIIGSAIAIRLILQLIPFTRLGS
mgnify:CR=1 FL=1